MLSEKISTTIKVIILLIWAGLFLALLQRDYFVKSLDLQISLIS